MTSQSTHFAEAGTAENQKVANARVISSALVPDDRCSS